MKNHLYLLTGATGLLGGNLVRELIARKERVRAFVLPNDKVIASIPKGVEIFEGDLLDIDALDRFFAAEDTDQIVIHAASIVTMDPKPNEKVRAVNVDGTRNIVEKCLQYKVKKLVYISSTSVIPELPKGQTIREVDSFDPEKVTGYYAKTKAMATELVMKAARERNLDASVIFPSGIFGPNDYGFGMITSYLKMAAEGRMPVAIGGTFNSVDARDLTDGILACAEKGRQGEGYIMASRCYTFAELARSISDAAGVRAPLMTLPLWFIKPFAGLGAFYASLRKQPAWFSRFTVYNLERNNDYSAEKAAKELGFRCRPLDESVNDTIRWLRQVGQLGYTSGK